MLANLNPKKEVVTVEETEVKDKPSNKIILWNDDVNSFEWVIYCLMNYCRHTFEQADQCAVIIHSKGKCSIKEGSYDDLKPICEALCENGLSAEIQ